MPKQFTLGKNERLKSRKEIDLVFSEGKSFNVFPYKVHYRQSDPVAIVGNRKSLTQNKELKTCLQFGIGVSGKLFPRAVDRNQIKRLTREAYRLQKLELQEKILNLNCRLIVFFNYTSKELADFHLVWEKTGIILRKLCKMADEKSFGKT